MNNKRFLWLAALACTLARLPAAAAPQFNAGYLEFTLAQPNGHQARGALWYPTTTAPHLLQTEESDLNVAQDAAAAPGKYPLVVISHGAFSNRRGHEDTAEALAQSGIIAAAIDHDDLEPNFALRLYDRGRQLSSLIDYATSASPLAAHIDSGRIGAMGFSIGGYTVLMAAGAIPNIAAIAPHCRDASAEWSCALLAKGKLDLTGPNPQPPITHDTRLRALVVIAPAMGYLFAPHGLQALHMPVQLWQDTDDHVIPAAFGADPVRAALPQPPEYHLVPNATHGDFGAPCPSRVIDKVPDLCGKSPIFDRARFHLSLDAEILRFFHTNL